jgi:hypothetical protein
MTACFIRFVTLNLVQSLAIEGLSFYCGISACAGMTTVKKQSVIGNSFAFAAITWSGSRKKL